MGARITRLDDDAIAKSGSRVLPREEAALRLVGKLSDVPVPEVLYSHYSELGGDLFMSLIPGSTLKDLWDSLDEKTKERLCHDIWSLIGKIRQIPKPPECNNFFLCSADGSCSQDVYVEDLKSPPQPLVNDAAVRARIFERYYHFYGRRYTEEEILAMLPHSQSSVFTHGDIAPQNIMVDSHTHKITGLIDWEFAGWYPDYWEYLRIHKAINNKNWREWMDRTAPQKWDLAGFVAVRRVLF
ncbi:kinase-like protein [Amniculicola lignicola CBS 123094]|uniref:Kinase-like protein n=1 Tax=Amniculicola lignicola CBS 123094 TaxID=1392246 RepID=A0A6A5X0E7_9PLEO|nr:kinase-like protein [Amniculicola lignicola CBS 123094]